MNLGRYKTFIYTHLGIAAGLVVGSLGGFFGILAGVILGALTDEMRSQGRSDKEIARYLENPGKAGFLEPSPGLTAYCALGTLLVAGRAAPFSDGSALGERVARNAQRVFRLAEKEFSTIDTYCRLAAEARQSLNPDLLAESLAARRGPLGDLPYLWERLKDLAMGAGAEEEFRRIGDILAPRAAKAVQPFMVDHDPWAILGLDRNATQDMIKSTFRKLAIQFHPDSVRDLREDQQRQVAEAFIKIQNAYKGILNTRRPGVSSPQGS